MTFLQLFVLVIYCYGSSLSFEITTSSRQKDIFSAASGNINAFPKCVKAIRYSDMSPSSCQNKNYLCNALCEATSDCNGFVNDGTTCTLLLSYLLLPSMPSSTGTEYFSAKPLSGEVDIARNKAVLPTCNQKVIPTFPFFQNYASPSTVTGGIACVKSETDCWCCTAPAIAIDLGVTYVITKIVITPHPLMLNILGVNMTNIYVVNVSPPSFSGTPYGTVGTIPVAGQNLEFSGNATGRYVGIVKMGMTPDPALCLCFVQVFGHL